MRLNSEFAFTAQSAYCALALGQFDCGETLLSLNTLVWPSASPFRASPQFRFLRSAQFNPFQHMSRSRLVAYEPCGALGGSAGFAASGTQLLERLPRAFAGCFYR